MNSTQWETLTDFVKWLGKEGHCVVDETEKGWFIQYVDRDPETIQRQEALQKKERMDMDDEEKRARFIQQQVERSHKDLETDSSSVYTGIQRQSEDEKVEFRLPVAPATKKVTSFFPSTSTVLESGGTAVDKTHKRSTESASSGKKRKSALEEIMEMEEEQKKKKQKMVVGGSSHSKATDSWLMKGIVVKIVTPKLGDKYYRKKGIVMDIVDK